MCQNPLGFLPLPSWRRRNFVSLQLELLVQLKPGCFSLPPAPFCSLLLINNLLSERRGSIEPVDSPLTWKVLLTGPELHSEQACFDGSGWIHHNGENIFLPLLRPQNGREARSLCRWILGTLIVKISHLVSQGNCPLTLGVSCQNKHIGDNVCQLGYSPSCSCSTYFPPLPFRHFLSCMCQQQHRDYYFRQNAVEWMKESPWQTIWNMKHGHVILQDSMLQNQR